MKANVGTIDRVLRVIAGLVLLSLVFIGPKTMWGLIGLVPLGTAAIGFCPAYLPFGLNTCGTKKG
ncbi:DUF2892 domain-containing protein [Acidocella sp.]|uniref:YgaP family membrane protein n=1 Tax=Acidocella sp. TaxID=50710 RepID=UPI002612B412|nr:DUF2892 domain-containing protein [Acidocella sp.]